MKIQFLPPGPEPVELKYDCYHEYTFVDLKQGRKVKKVIAVPINVRGKADISHTADSAGQRRLRQFDWIHIEEEPNAKPISRSRTRSIHRS